MKLAEGIGGLTAARAYDLFSFWYAYNAFAHKTKKFEEFARSPYFKIFVDLVGYCERAGVTSAREYLRWLTDKRVASKLWMLDATLKAHRAELHKREDAVSATVRCVDRIVIWCGQRATDPSAFFDVIGPGELVQWIKTGKMTPWVLLISEQGESALAELSDEQMHALSASLDVGYWIGVFQEKPEVVEEAKQVLDAVGLLFKEAV